MPKHLFQPGQSGNPGGKPKVPPDVQALLKAATPRATRKLISLMGSKDPAIALRAAEAIMNRVYGTPRQSVEVQGDTPRFVMWLPPQSASAEDWERECLEDQARRAQPVLDVKPIDTTDPRLPVQFTGIRTPRSS